MDYTNKEQVIAWAVRLGKGMTVCWNGQNYNIIHTCREPALLKGRPVVYRT